MVVRCRSCLIVFVFIVSKLELQFQFSEVARFLKLFYILSIFDQINEYSTPQCVINI